MLGDAAANTFDGAASDDVLDGGAGNDVLIGGQGSDTLTGGAGDDVFDLSDHDGFFADPPADDLFSLDRAKGDVVTDFASGRDKLRLDLDTLFQGKVAAVTIENGAGNAAEAGAAVLHFDTQTRTLWFDEDGAGSGFDTVQIGTIETLAQLKASDVLLV